MAEVEKAGGGTHDTDSSNHTGGNQGEVPYVPSGGGLALLGVGTSGQVLQTNGAGADPSWVNAAGGGDVTAAANIGDNLLVRGDGAGKGVQNSGITVDDSDNVTGVNNVTGADTNFVTGTAGTSGDVAIWNADGDIVDGPTPPSGTILGTTDTQTLTNKALVDASTTIVDDGDNTKAIAFQASGITTATTRTITMPDQDVDLTPTTGTYAATSHAATHADGGADELAVQDLASDAATDGQVAKADGSGGVAFEDDIASINFIIDGGGATITTGVKGYIEVSFACTILEMRLLADQSGSIVVDIWKDTYANYPPVDADSITASAVPTITTATKAEDTTLTGWTTTINAEDILGFNVDSVTTIERCTVVLKVRKT